MSLTHYVTEWLAEVTANPWQVIVPLTGIILVAVLYWRGAWYEGRTGIGRRITALRAASFYTGLLVLLAAIASPLDVLADEGLAAHMVQHELLMLVVPPLLLLGTPLWPLWRALPLNWRRASLRWLMRRHWAKRTGEQLARMTRSAVIVWSIFIGVFLVWHIPALYDFALRDEAAHALEHSLFLLVALMFWAQVIPSFPLQPRLSFMRRAGYLFAAAMALHLFSILIGISVQPIYPYYGTGPEIVANQSAGGAIMDVSGQIVFTTAILICVGLWLRDEDRRGQMQDEGTSTEPAPNISARGALLIAEADLAESSVGDEDRRG
ncbi:MAG: cytochrome c oxidase assembly protein [Nitrososphaerota archaeon]